MQQAGVPASGVGSASPRGEIAAASGSHHWGRGRRAGGQGGTRGGMGGGGGIGSGSGSGADSLSISSPQRVHGEGILLPLTGLRCSYPWLWVQFEV